MTRKKIIIFIVLLILAVFLLVWFLTMKNSEVEEASKNIETIKIINDLPLGIKKPVFSNQGISILRYNWEEANINIPEYSGIFVVKDRQIEDELVGKFKSYFGLNSNPVEDSENAVAFVNKPEGKTFYINKKDLTASYYVDLVTQDIKPKENRVDDKNLIESLKNIVKSMSDWPNSLSLQEEKIERQDILGMMYWPGENSTSRVVYIEMVYKLNNIPIFTKKGLPVAARFFDDGTLLKLSLSLPFSEQKNIGQLPIKNIEKVKTQPNYEFKLLSIKDARGTELLSEDGDAIIQELKISKGYLGYVYEVGNNILQPFLVFEGAGFVDGKKVVLIVGTPALNDDEYN